ncbi:M14 family metallocarboxypeptidase [Chitinibacter bivalviorum]|uniref:M14 family metallocarboxypeptidase n=1 Tax=Chitinibacter bivalviorum TaxID=2739434 RepID=A0A7H9BL09_9NEIS|nr:M14 family metallocarboxypeptidase [Chitinibacter bivalviorum]QLG89365.1 M14 family metallocarboxypeptidase [Chitinibacter bivalviorum]
MISPLTSYVYPIGQLGQAWAVAEKAQWLAMQHKKRSYHAEVVAPLRDLLARDATLAAAAELIEYGTLDYQALGLGSYPLLAVRSRHWQADRPVALITGGVHGYETSGVQGCVQFIAQQWLQFAADFNLLILPCISPWGYETINRWNPLAIDPNRSFVSDSPAPEAAAAMKCVQAQAARYAVHIDLHETTDTDNSEFGPAKAARDGVAFEYHDIPDGFYLVGDSEKPAADFQRSIIDAVAKVTHIAAADAQGCLIGEPLQQLGVINYAKKALGLCGGITDAPLVTTTEVYPDSPSANAEQCNQAQVAAISAALRYAAAN